MTDKTPAAMEPTTAIAGNGSEDVRMQALSAIKAEQSATMAYRRELIGVRVRVATTRENHEALRARAIQLEAEKMVVPGSLKSFIARASEEHDVAFAVYQSRLKTASTEKAAASTARDALREWRACIPVHILHGKNAPEVHDLIAGPEQYDPEPPHEPPRTVENVAWKDPNCEMRSTLDKHLASWATLRDHAQYLTSRSEPVPETHHKALQQAASSVLAAEIHMCKMLATANSNVRAGLAEGSIPVTVRAMRVVNWLQGFPPPSKADFPPGWSPTAVPTSLPDQNSFALLPVDDNDYEYEASPQPTAPVAQEEVEESERAQDPRGGKKRREHKDATDTAEADPSCVDDLVLNRAAEAKAITAEAQKEVIRAMEVPTAMEQNAMLAQAQASAMAQAAIATPSDTCPPTAVEPGMTGAQGLAAAAIASPAEEALTKTQRSARDSNARFFATIQPRLDGRADPVPCFKCEIPDCILASKSKGDKAPTFQAQMQGKKCGKTVAPSVCMAFWYGAGTLHEYLPTTSPANVDPDTVTPRASTQAKAQEPELDAQRELARRANQTESALISLEQALREASKMQARIAATMAARDSNFQALVESHNARSAKDKKEADSVQGILAAIQTNIVRTKDAKTQGSVATLVPIPAQYISDPALPTQQAPLALSNADATQQRSWGPGSLPPHAFPAISRAGPQVPSRPLIAGSQAPAKPLDRAAIRMTYSRALASSPRSTVQHRITSRRNRDMNEVGFILLTNFDHQAISQTKRDFGEYLELGTDILHYRRMPLQGLELALPNYQLSTVSIQLRQMGYRLAPDCLPSNPMTRRRPGETESQRRDRAAYCAHRAMSKVAADPRANTAVSDWFARACDSLATANPHVFTDISKKKWSSILAQEAASKSPAQAALPDKTAPSPNLKAAQDNPTSPAPTPSTAGARGATQPMILAPEKEPASSLSTPPAPAIAAKTTSQARDNSVPGAK